MTQSKYSQVFVITCVLIIFPRYSITAASMDDDDLAEELRRDAMQRKAAEKDKMGGPGPRGP